MAATLKHGIGDFSVTKIGQFVLVTILAHTVLVRGCTEYDLEQCWEPMQNLSDHLDWDTIVPTLSEENMREHCRLYNEVEVCLKTLSCGTLQEGVHEGLESAYHYLCDQTFDEYLEHRVCFNNTDLHKEGTHCNATLLARLGSLNSSTSVSYRHQRICQYANDYLDCVENAVTSFCGRSAASWQRELDYRSLAPLLSRTGCVLDGNRVYYPPQDSPPEHTSRAQTYIIVGCVGALSLVVLLIFVVLMVTMYNKRKAAAAAANQRGRMDPHTTVDMASFPGTDLPPGAYGAQAGPLPMKQPPPYNEAPPEYSLEEKKAPSENGSAVNGAASMVGDSRPPSEYSRRGTKNGYPNSRASSDAGSVYSGVSSRSGGPVSYHAGGKGSKRSHRSGPRMGDDYF